MPRATRVLGIGLAVVLVQSAGAFGQDPVAEANRLLVQALQKVAQVEAADSRDARFALLRDAVALLDRIVEEHPETDLAVKVISNQNIGEFTGGQIRRAHDLAFSRLCTVDPTPSCLAPLADHARDLVVRLDETAAALDRQTEISSQAREQVGLLGEQLQELRRQTSALGQALEAAEADNQEQRAMVVDLGNRLNRALATRVQELAAYRSEFFGRLREVLGSRADVQIVGDRFVLQSEVLFPEGEADLVDDGKAALLRLADTMADIGSTIPDDVDWVLRVDGHTDERLISTPEFPSNWDLSTARALSVVKFLVDEGLPPDRLMAAGFGQFNPLDPRQDAIGFRRNRRIEFILTQR